MDDATGAAVATYVIDTASGCSARAPAAVGSKASWPHVCTPATSRIDESDAPRSWQPWAAAVIGSATHMDSQIAASAGETDTVTTTASVSNRDATHRVYGGCEHA